MGGWLQAFWDEEHVGSALLNLVVDELDRALAELEARSPAAGPAQPGAATVRFAALHEPTATASP
ncbi:hypothetical protein [Streptomyces sp. NPDC096033]|uniref:hypothetical protein n=1 Tax=Streptomyces sp. NPDC096033 TaxID=3366071 RepID=UPI0037F24A6C